jgi:hypothetical protein
MDARGGIIGSRSLRSRRRHRPRLGWLGLAGTHRELSNQASPSSLSLAVAPSPRIPATHDDVSSAAIVPASNEDTGGWWRARTSTPIGRKPASIENVESFHTKAGRASHLGAERRALPFREAWPDGLDRQRWAVEMAAGGGGRGG